MVTYIQCKNGKLKLTSEVYSETHKHLERVDKYVIIKEIVCHLSWFLKND